MNDFPPTLGNHHLHNVACIKGGGDDDEDDAGPIFFTFSTFMSLLMGNPPGPCLYAIPFRSIFRSYSFFLFHPTAMHSNFLFNFLPLLSLIGFFFFFCARRMAFHWIFHCMVRNIVSSGFHSSCWASMRTDCNETWFGKRYFFSQSKWKTATWKGKHIHRQAEHKLCLAIAFAFLAKTEENWKKIQFSPRAITDSHFLWKEVCFPFGS